jgi:predicted RNA-binding Zn-ribbon protein involved in translation (DUF1610 family)
MPMPVDPEQQSKSCDECGSPFFAAASKMHALCPECAHHLYGYPSCDHVWDNDHCTQCGWNGSRSKYVRGLIRKATQSSEEPPTEPNRGA